MDKKITQVIQTIKGERGIPSVGNATSTNGRKIPASLYAIIVLSLTGLFLYFSWVKPAQHTAEAPQKEAQVTSSIPQRDFEKDKVPEPLALNTTTVATSESDAQATSDKLPFFCGR